MDSVKTSNNLRSKLGVCISGIAVLLIPVLIFIISVVLNNREIARVREADFMARYERIGRSLTVKAAAAMDENLNINDKFASELYTLPSLLDDINVVVLVDKLNRPVFSAGNPSGRNENIIRAGTSALMGENNIMDTKDNGLNLSVFSFPIYREGGIIAAVVMEVDSKSVGGKLGSTNQIPIRIVYIALAVWLIFAVLGVFRLHSRGEDRARVRQAELALTTLGYSYIDIRKLANASLETIVSGLRLRDGSIYLKDRLTGEIRHYGKYSVSTDPAQVDTAIFDPADPRLQAITESKAKLYSLSKTGHARLINKTDKSEKFRRIALPLVGDNKVFGLLDIGIEQGIKLNQEFILSCRDFAMRTAESIKGALDHMEAARQLRDTMEILESVYQVNSGTDMAESLHKITINVTETKNVRFCRIYLLDEDMSNLVLMSETWAGEGIGNENSGSRYKVDDMPIHKITMLSGQPHVIKPDEMESVISLKKDLDRQGMSECIILIVPIINGGGQMGCISIGMSTLKEIPSEIQHRFETLAHYLGSAIERTRTCDRLKRSFDNLMGVQNQKIQNERLSAISSMSKALSENLVRILAYLRESMGELGDQSSDERLMSVTRTLDMEIETYSEIVRRFSLFVELDSHAHYQQIELAQVIRETMQDLKGDIKTSSISGKEIILAERISGSGQIHGNRESLKIMIRELILNSYEAMIDGGTIVLETRIEMNSGIIEISDQGPGMSEDVKKRIFEPFFTTREGAGRGLGMSMVYGIVAAHNGSIDISSEFGIGTRFLIRIPLVDPEQTALYNIKKGTTRSIPLSSS